MSKSNGEAIEVRLGERERFGSSVAEFLLLVQLNIY